MKNIFKNKKLFLAIVFIWFVLIGFYQTHKPLPEGVNYASSEYRVSSSDVRFLNDLTYIDKEGNVKHEQKIFDAILSYIDEASQYILIDMFLYNDYGAKTTEAYRKLADELTDNLIKKKQVTPGIKIDVITDPINIVYGGGHSEQIDRLRQAGINVVITDLRKLRDSNYLYSSFWRTFLQWFGNSDKHGWIAHPFDKSQDDVSLRSYLSLLNFKANHRKVFASDSRGQDIAIVTSANPHDGSSAHSNVAMLVRGEIVEAVYETESGVVKFSKGEIYDFPDVEYEQTGKEDSSVQIITEKRIKEKVLNEINSAKTGDKLKIAQFYMAERDIIKALIKASKRGAEIMLILDPNKDAFGYEKNGIPNRQVARELIKKTDGNIKVRWYLTHGEQFHTKLFICESGERFKVILGSANYTRRNIDNYNLEMNIFADLPVESGPAVEMGIYFDRIWNNQEGEYALDYSVYEDNSLLKRIMYRVQEGLGLSSF